MSSTKRVTLELLWACSFPSPDFCLLNLSLLSVYFFVCFYFASQGHDDAVPCAVLKSVDSFSFLHHPVHQRSLEILQRCKEEKYSKAPPPALPSDTTLTCPEMETRCIPCQKDEKQRLRSPPWSKQLPQITFEPIGNRLGRAGRVKLKANPYLLRSRKNHFIGNFPIYSRTLIKNIPDTRLAQLEFNLIWISLDFRNFFSLRKYWFPGLLPKTEALSMLFYGKMHLVSISSSSLLCHVINSSCMTTWTLLPALLYFIFFNFYI